VDSAFEQSSKEKRGAQMKNICLLFCVLISTYLHAQNAAVKADRYKIKIGEQIKLNLRANPLKNQRVIWPVVGDSLGQWFEVVRKDTLDTLNTAGLLTLEQHVWITSFDTGRHNLPVFPFEFILPEGDTQHVVSDMLSIQILDVAVDTTKEFKDIRSIETVPEDYSHLYKIGAIVLAALIIIGIILWLILRKRKSQKMDVVVTPPIVPWQKALSALDILQQQAIWRDGKTKEFHSELTDVLRTYIEEHFKLPAMESTTEETMAMLRKSGLNNEVTALLNDILILADLVKFAKVNPQPEEHEHSVKHAKAFILKTRPVEKQDETPKSEEA
jgi:hypothetical protein